MEESLEAKAPRKSQNLAWRACLNDLPTLDNMQMRGLCTNYTCLVYEEEAKCLKHNFITRDFALSVWALWQVCPLSLLLETRDFKDLAFYFHMNSPSQHLEFFFAISWPIWHNRNLQFHNEGNLSPLQTWELSKRLVDDLHDAITMDFPPKQLNQMDWSAPHPRAFKVNGYVVSSLEMGVDSGVGVVIRDKSGRVIAALCKFLPLQFLANWMELYALEQGILLAPEMELSQVIFETNALSIIQAINQGIIGSEAGYLVEGILHMSLHSSPRSTIVSKFGKMLPHLLYLI